MEGSAAGFAEERVTLDCEEGVIRLGSVTPGEAIVGCGESSTESSSR